MSDGGDIGDGRWAAPRPRRHRASPAPTMAVAQQAPPSNVFDVSPSLAIEAARTRLRLFVDENPGGWTGASSPISPSAR